MKRQVFITSREFSGYLVFTQGLEGMEGMEGMEGSQETKRNNQVDKVWRSPGLSRAELVPYYNSLSQTIIRINYIASDFYIIALFENCVSANSINSMAR